MNILKVKEKAKEFGIRGDFKALYDFCLNSLNSLDENELKSLLSLDYYDDINCPTFLWFSVYPNSLSIINDKEFQINICPKNYPCTVNIPLGITELDICISHEEKPIVYFSGALFFNRKNSNFPDWILSMDSLTSALKSIFGDCLVLDDSYDVDDSAFEEFIKNHESRCKDSDEFTFYFGVLATWFN